MRSMLTPAAIISSSTDSLADAGPTVATIFVRRKRGSYFTLLPLPTPAG